MRAYLGNRCRGRPLDSPPGIRIANGANARMAVQRSMSQGKMGLAVVYVLYSENKRGQSRAAVGCNLDFMKRFRRSYVGRNLFQNGVKVEDIATILGHQDTKTTLRYLGLDRIDHSSHMNMLDFGEEEDQDDHENRRGGYGKRSFHFWPNRGPREFPKSRPGNARNENAGYENKGWSGPNEI